MLTKLAILPMLTKLAMLPMLELTTTMLKLATTIVSHWTHHVMGSMASMTMR